LLPGTPNNVFTFFFSGFFKKIYLSMYVLFWVILQRLNFICRRFGTLFHLHRQVGKFDLFTYLPMKMEQTEYSETLAYKIQRPGNYPEENIQHTEHGESLKSRNLSWHVNEE
jgi:hypothetical protein